MESIKKMSSKRKGLRQIGAKNIPTKTVVVTMRKRVKKEPEIVKIKCEEETDEKYSTVDVESHKKRKTDVKCEERPHKKRRMQVNYLNDLDGMNPDNLPAIKPIFNTEQIQTLRNLDIIKNERIKNIPNPHKLNLMWTLHSSAKLFEDFDPWFTYDDVIVDDFLSEW